MKQDPPRKILLKLVNKNAITQEQGIALLELFTSGTSSLEFLEKHSIPPYFDFQPVCIYGFGLNPKDLLFSDFEGGKMKCNDTNANWVSF